MDEDKVKRLAARIMPPTAMAMGGFLMPHDFSSMMYMRGCS